MTNFVCVVTNLFLMCRICFCRCCCDSCIKLKYRISRSLRTGIVTESYGFKKRISKNLQNDQNDEDSDDWIFK